MTSFPQHKKREELREELKEELKEELREELRNAWNARKNVLPTRMRAKGYDDALIAELLDLDINYVKQH